MALKMVLFFQQAARGWTETYYAPGNNPQTFSQTNINNNTMNAWMGLRANDVALTEVRVSLIGSPRVTYSTPFQLFSNNAFDEFANYNQDTFGEDCLLLLRSNTGLPRHLWIRGLPNIYIVYGPSGIPQPPAELLARIQILGSQMQQMGLQIQNANIPVPTSGSWFRVVSVAPAASTPGQVSSTLQCVTVPPITTPFAPLYFQGIPRNFLPGFPRIITPTAIGVSPLNTVEVPYLFRGPSNPVFTAKMQFTSLAYIYNAITSVAFETYGTRKTGRPTGLPRGRSPVVIRRQ